MRKTLKLPTKKPTRINLEIQLTLTFKSWNRLFDQLSAALPMIIKQILDQIFTQVADNIKKELRSMIDISFYKEKQRKFLTQLGEVYIPDYEVRLKGKYLGRFIPTILQAKKHEYMTEGARILISKIITKTTYREASDILSPIFEISHQRLNYYIRTIKTTNLISFLKMIPKKIKNRIFCYLDGTVIKVRVKHLSPVTKETIRIVWRESIQNGKMVTKLAFGFLESTYGSLIEQVIDQAERSKAIAFCDGEKIIRAALTGFRAIQRCIFHFSWNLISKLTTDGMGKEEAESLVNELKDLVYLRTKNIRKFGKHYKEVIKARQAILKYHVKQLNKKGFSNSAIFINNAIPHLFSYVKIYIQDKIWSGRTNNRMERLMRAIAKRMKRVGCVWSYTGAQKMAYLILIEYFKIPYIKSKPLNFSISCRSVANF